MALIQALRKCGRAQDAQHYYDFVRAEIRYEA